MKWTTKRPRIGGNYLTKDEDGEVSINILYYCRRGRDWWLFDYPHSHGSKPLEDGDIYLWGPRVS